MKRPLKIFVIIFISVKQMKINYLKSCFLLLSLCLITGCVNTNFFNIQLWYKETYDEVNLLMREIYQHAANNNIDFFRPFVERSRRVSAERMGTEPRLEEDSIIADTKDFMSQFVEARIYRTYKTNAFLTGDGILFDFSQDRRSGGTNFMIILTFDQNWQPLLYRFFHVR